jgi:hypothetical protein
MMSAIYMDKNQIYDVKLTSTSFSQIIVDVHVYNDVITFPITERVLQNNERSFPLIFAITMLE